MSRGRAWRRQASKRNRAKVAAWWWLKGADGYRSAQWLAERRPNHKAVHSDCLCRTTRKNSGPTLAEHRVTA